MGEHMDEKPFLSIIIPVYNGEKYIDRAAGAVLNQEFGAWELILVDDCSEDKSLAKCLEWSSRDCRIKCVGLHKNMGAGNARNMGLDLANGRYITFMDVDDYIDSNLYSTVTKNLTDGQETDVVVWGVTEEYQDKNGNVTDKNVISVKDKMCSDAQTLRKAIIFLEDKSLFGYQWNHIYRNDIIRDNNIRFENTRLYEDYFFNLQVARVINSMEISSCTGYHYIKGREGNVTGSFVKDYFELSQRRISSMTDAYREWRLYSPTVKKICGERYIRYILSALMRNNMPQAGMNHKMRKGFVRKIYKDELYKKTGESITPGSKILRLLKWAINHRLTCVVLLMGYGAYVTKCKLPALFSKKTKIG